jgi:Tfp pilus assembly protein PilO
MNKILSLLPTQSLIYILACGVAVIAFIFLIIIPNQNTAEELDQEIQKINDHFEQQRILRPVFESLLEQAKKERSANLPATKIVKLDRGDINKVSELLQDIAGRRGLKIQDIRTDANEIMNNTGYMLMRIHATGDFMKFREFLMDLATFPSLEQIEEVKIRAIEGSREYKLKIWMAQKLHKTHE